MIRVVGSLLARHMALIALFVTGVPAWAESVERVEQVERVAPGVPAGTDTALPPAAVSEQTSRPVGERLSDYETMELHLRRYGAAANSMAQLFKQLNQKIQEVSLAAKTFEAKSNSHNRRLLEEKLRQLENMRASFSSQHNQLQSQMQNEYRSYAALSSSLKAKYDTLDELQAKVDTAKAAKEAKEAKESKSDASKGKQTKPKESGAQEAKGAESQARQETRATNPQSSAKPAADSTASPTLHPIP
jgi:septal ring factor EnvC (AmiA/AmiB activator)